MHSSNTHLAVWALAIMAPVSPVVARAGIGLHYWHHKVTVEEYPTGRAWDEYGVETLRSPFQESLSVQVGETEASAAYDFVFDDEAGTFYFETSQSAMYIQDESYSRVRGGFYFQPTLDAEVSIVGAMTYNLPSVGTEAWMGLEIVDLPAQNLLFSTSSGRGGPGAGTLKLDDSYLLPAGGQYIVDYTFGMDAYPKAQPGAIGTGAASVTIAIRTIPEPGGAGALSLGALALFAQRRRGSSKKRARRCGHVAGTIASP